MTYSHEQLKAMCPLSISECSQKHVQSVVAELIETALAQPASVPAGWKLVPVEPTDDMLANVDEEVGGHCHSCTKWNASWSDCRRVYAAMLAAAPQAPQPAQADMAPEYAAAVRELAEQSGMSGAQVLRAAIRLYQAERKGLVTVEHKEQIGPLAAPQPAQAVPDADAERFRWLIDDRNWNENEDTPSICTSEDVHWGDKARSLIDRHMKKD